VTPTSTLIAHASATATASLPLPKLRIWFKKKKRIWFYLLKFCFCKDATSLTHCIHVLLFDSVVAVAFQIAFRAKIYANDVFLFFKNHF
jgi:hypothetical protein